MKGGCSGRAALKGAGAKWEKGKVVRGAGVKGAKVKGE